MNYLLFQNINEGRQYNPKTWARKEYHEIKEFSQFKSKRKTKRLESHNGRFKFTRQETKFYKGHKCNITRYLCCKVKKKGVKCRACIFERIEPDGSYYMFNETYHKCQEISKDEDDLNLIKKYNELGKGRGKKQKTQKNSNVHDEGNNNIGFKRKRKLIDEIQLETQMEEVISNDLSGFDNFINDESESDINLSILNDYNDLNQFVPQMRMIQNDFNNSHNINISKQNTFLTSHSINAMIYGCSPRECDISGGELVTIYFNLTRQNPNMFQSFIRPDEAREMSLSLNISARPIAISSKNRNGAFKKKDFQNWEKCENANLEMIVRVKSHIKAECVDVIMSQGRKSIGTLRDGFTYTDINNINENDSKSIDIEINKKDYDIMDDMDMNNFDVDKYILDEFEIGNVEDIPLNYDQFEMFENTLFDIENDCLNRNKKIDYTNVPLDKFIRIANIFKKSEDVFGFDLIQMCIARNMQKLCIFLMNLYKFQEEEEEEEEEEKENNGSKNDDNEMSFVKNTYGLSHVDNFGNSHLHWAYYYGTERVIEYLEKKTKINVNKLNGLGLKPSEFTKETWERNHAHKQMEKGDLGMKINSFTRIILNTNDENGIKEVERFLESVKQKSEVKFEKQWNEEFNNYIVSPISYCCATGKIEIARMLLKDSRFDPLQNDGELMMVCKMKGNKEIPKLLEEHEKYKDKSTDTGKYFDKLKTKIANLEIKKIANLNVDKYAKDFINVNELDSSMFEEYDTPQKESNVKVVKEYDISIKKVKKKKNKLKIKRKTKKNKGRSKRKNKENVKKKSSLQIQFDMNEEVLRKLTKGKKLKPKKKKRKKKKIVDTESDEEEEEELIQEVSTDSDSD